MIRILLFLTLFSSSIGYTQENHFSLVEKGIWTATLKLNDSDVLYFTLSVKEYNSFFVHNAKEIIPLNAPLFKNDSFYVSFPYFNSELVFHAAHPHELNGYWVNYNKGNHYKIPFHAENHHTSRFPLTAHEKFSDFSGNWKVLFEPNSNSSYPSLGVFQQDSNQLTGTFLTETGDYRFLEGNVTKDSLYLSCFDGSHAFLFKGKYVGDSLIGTFNSGSHWKSTWVARRDSTFQLANPETLTYLVDNDYIDFDLPSITGTPFTFPNPEYEDKVVIIQLMGTWCPNCLDETIYYKELYETYHSRGLEIISIGYEVGSSYEQQVKSLQRLRDKLDLNFTFLVGGTASKKTASEQFEELNEIISFPTSIFIGRDGKVKRIHTGFNGPGTGSYYEEYTQYTHSLIESLLID